MSGTPGGRPEIVLRPMGSPLALGLCGLVIASLVLSGLDLGWVSTADARLVGIMLLPEDAQDRPVLPTFRRGRASLSAAERANGAGAAPREAGVRPQL